MKNEMQFSWGQLSSGQANLFLANSVASARIILRKLANPKILWINKDAISQDLMMEKCLGDVGAYRRNIVQSCAYTVDGLLNETAVAWSDRYGGSGIGSCGGSGRAAILNGYHVKGIGKTPLLGCRMIDAAHSTGHVGLEEAIREAIYSEAMSNFPWSAIRILAIIDTGLDYQWDASLGRPGSNIERRVLVVRPLFLRPAHFERAEKLILASVTAGGKDAERVERAIETLINAVGVASIGDIFVQCAKRWAEQMAHGFVSRLTQHNHSTSNICLDGKLVDFGGARYRPACASVRLAHGFAPHSDELDVIFRSVKNISENLDRYGRNFTLPAATISDIREAYNSEYINSLLDIISLGGINIRKRFSGIDCKQFCDIVLLDQEVRSRMKLAFKGAANFSAARCDFDSNVIFQENLLSAVHRAISLLFPGKYEKNDLKITLKPGIRQLIRENIQDEVSENLTPEIINGLEAESLVSRFIEDKLKNFIYKEQAHAQLPTL